MAEKLKIVWLVNILFPKASEILGLPKSVIGGWLYSYKVALKQYYPQIELHIISPYAGKFPQFLGSEENDYYYVFPFSMHEKKLKRWFLGINKRINPHIVHIYGSEYIHSSIYVKACGSTNVVLSIQGMISVYAQYFYGGIEKKELNTYSTFRDILKRETIQKGQNTFYRNGQAEIWLIKQINNIIGRTSWDYANSWSLNSSLHYYKCEEALRGSFYTHQWSINKCHRHTIFISQAHYPIKGLHKMLEALPIILKSYPDTRIYITGDDPTLKPWYRRTGYWNYLKYIIDKLKIRNHLNFLGRLSEEEMVIQYLSANVFVCPSIIENSSNSVCEAQILGTPVIASYVGGMMDLIDDGKSGFLYRFEETALLAKKVCEIFENDNLACQLSINARSIAAQRHNRENIANTLYAIYLDIMNRTK